MLWHRMWLQLEPHLDLGHRYVSIACHLADVSLHPQRVPLCAARNGLAMCSCLLHELRARFGLVCEPGNNNHNKNYSMLLLVLLLLLWWLLLSLSLLLWLLSWRLLSLLVFFLLFLLSLLLLSLLLFLLSLSLW